MSPLIILQQMAVIAILVLIGVYLQKKNILDEVTQKKMSTLVMDVVNPALIMSCILTGNITATHQDLLTAIGIGVGLYSFLCLMGIIVPWILPIKKEERKFYNLMTVYANVGFIGIPVGRAILSESAMLYVIVCNVMFCLLFYTYGVAVLKGKSGKKLQQKKIAIRMIFSPGTVMAILTLLLFWFDLSLPPVLSNSIIYVGNATVFLSMSLLGASLAKSPVKDGLKDASLWIFLILRMVGIPVLLVVILKALHLQTEMIQAFFLMAAMPAANLPLIQAEKTGEKTDILSKGIMVSTLLCFFTITILMSVLF